MSAPARPIKKAKKQWKGEKRAGPAPARHIPWPELFKHHISVVEGHLKMMEMVQKHTTPETGNWKMITSLVERSHEMLKAAKDSSRSFVPPKGQREQVPLGSSSETMYPGYSPAHIEYGKAAQEAGEALSKARQDGELNLPNGVEYKLGQAHGEKRKMFHNAKSETNGKDSEAKTSEDDDAEMKDAEQPAFVIDTEPTPVDLPSHSKKRASEEDDGEKKKKKSRKEKAASPETEDISAEVEAKLKAKKDKADGKVDKRKRESIGDVEKDLKKSKKDKKRKDVEGGGEDDGEKKKKKSKDSE